MQSSNARFRSNPLPAKLLRQAFRDRMSSARQHVPAATSRRIFGRAPAVRASAPVCASMAHRLLDDRRDHGNKETAMSRHDGSKRTRISRRSVLKGAAAVGGSAARIKRDRISDDMGAKHQGRRAAPRRPAGDRDPADCGAGDEGPRLHRADAGRRRTPTS